MPPKKGKKKLDDAEVELDPDEKKKDLETQVAILEQEVKEKDAELQELRQEEAELKRKVAAVDESREQLQFRTRDVLADMTRHHKASHEALVQRINDLQGTFMEIQDFLLLAGNELQTLAEEKDGEIERHAEHAKQLKKDKEALSSEFAEMLQKVLAAVRARVSTDFNLSCPVEDDGNLESLKSKVENFVKKRLGGPGEHKKGISVWGLTGAQEGL
eukprot:Cvel_30808.t1-p1 / transcript=Cvel_30808.t1 / gene=Cvel_30808 / organism=Chromera_velia_CCMP2878 / gene_product=hypothetical protein / transcript_product=hypothetical protein / location=Cvel_scaffold4464:795-8475(-) / protein_length=215 / sequence_SO=supercontig / SO=protein_coding / is_pseudo=false